MSHYSCVTTQIKPDGSTRQVLSSHKVDTVEDAARDALRVMGNNLPQDWHVRAVVVFAEQGQLYNAVEQQRYLPELPK